ncbi:MAG: sigma-70 family RNA polymerase sigma factor [Proteobacteria bacterium]|jgi:RNA polymerase sigma-70 factor (ECF subfamily)|nr:sigma-70 family RNA polymerase sigma factor [Pseudomonadota bacterium]
MSTHHKDKVSESATGRSDESAGSLGDLREAREAAADRDAARRLLERIGPRVRHTVRLLVGRDDEIEDYTHACFVAILENLGKYKGTGPMEAWAGQLTYRVLMRQLKRRRRSERTVTLVAEDAGVISTTPEREAVRRSRMEMWAKHLHKLPDKRRETLVLRLVYGYSVAEVARLMDAPLNTVRDRIRVGLRELRQSLGVDPAAIELLGSGHFEDTDGE